MKNLINVQTGEILDKESSNKQLSEALKVCKIGIKDLQQKEKALKDVVYNRVESRARKFAQYWTVVWNREFDKKLFKSEASKEDVALWKQLSSEIMQLEQRIDKIHQKAQKKRKVLRGIESHYQRQTTVRSLNFPKHL